MERRCMVAYRVIESVPFDVTTTPLSQSISPWAIALRHKPKVAAGDMLFGRIVVEGMTTHEFPLVEEDIGAEVDKGQNVVNLVASIGHSACRVGNEIQRFTAASLALDVLVVPWSLLRLVAYVPPSLSAAASTSVGACIRQWLMSRRVVRKHEVVLYPQQAGVVVPILLVRTSKPDDNVQFVVADNVHRQLILTFATQLCTRCRITDAIAMGSLLFHNESITDDDGKDHQSVDDVVPLPSRHAPAIHLILKHVQALPMTTRTDNFSISWPVVIVPFEILSSEGGAGTLTVRLGNMRDFVAVTVIPFAADDGWGCTQRVAEGLEGKIVRPSEASPTALTFTTRHRVTLLVLSCIGSTGGTVQIESEWQPCKRSFARAEGTLGDLQAATNSNKEVNSTPGLDVHVHPDGFTVERNGFLVEAPARFADSHCAARLFKLLSGVGERRMGTVDSFQHEGAVDAETKGKACVTIHHDSSVLTRASTMNLFPGQGEKAIIS